jgi:hypothetical protein
MEELGGRSEYEVGLPFPLHNQFALTMRSKSPEGRVNARIELRLKSFVDYCVTSLIIGITV